jgi:hypothetical protein
VLAANPDALQNGLVWGLAVMQYGMSEHNIEGIGWKLHILGIKRKMTAEAIDV